MKGGQGCAGALIGRFITAAKEQGRMGVVLTCKDRLIHYYEKFGFVNEGLTAKSTHGGAEWYQMRLTFRDELFRCAENGEDYSFYAGKRRYLLYGWNQCDGVYLNIEDENGSIVWQATGRSREECAEKFISFYQEQF